MNTRVCCGAGVSPAIFYVSYTAQKRRRDAGATKNDFYAFAGCVLLVSSLARLKGKPRLRQPS